MSGSGGARRTGLHKVGFRQVMLLPAFSVPSFLSLSVSLVNVEGLFADSQFLSVALHVVFFSTLVGLLASGELTSWCCCKRPARWFECSVGSLLVDVSRKDAQQCT